MEQTNKTSKGPLIFRVVIIVILLLLIIFFIAGFFVHRSTGLNEDHVRIMSDKVYIETEQGEINNPFGKSVRDSDAEQSGLVQDVLDESSEDQKSDVEKTFNIDSGATEDIEDRI